ncbi:MAG: hypothetical protein HQK65_21625 [Desulfamplus sp.]|nr:hypothetical protein [Desulfamplus sp.]
MIDDPIIEEIRKYRNEHASRYGNDLRKIVAALREKERNSKREMINHGPKVLFQATGS